MTAAEIPLHFMCGKDRLYAILHRPTALASRGVVIVHGRPAYRTGVHRLFVQLARRWAEDGVPVLRFDYRGAGDCEGQPPTFRETVNDISAAVDAFFANSPGLRDVILWSSCGGAADAMLYASQDSRVHALALINPWSFEARRRARRKMRYYTSIYLRRMTRLDWWARIFRGESSLRTRARSLTRVLRDAAGIKANAPETAAAAASQTGLTPPATRAHLSYRDPRITEQLYRSVEKFNGKILLVLSGADSNAQSFKDLVASSPKWQKLLSSARVRRHDLPGADHSFRRGEWRRQLESWTLDWLQTL